MAAVRRIVGGRIVDSSSELIPLFSTTTSSSQTRSLSRIHTMTAFDYGKVSVLLIITIICFWSYFDTFYISSTGGSGFKKITINTDYKPCVAVANSQAISSDSKEQLAGQCRVEIDIAFKAAKHECKVYLANLNSCREAHASNCGAQEQTTESCYEALTGTALARWYRVARTGSISINEVSLKK